MIWAAAKRGIKSAVKAAGYRIVPAARDSMSLRRWLLRQPIRTVIDVGASTGETCKEWLARFPDADVHAVEPLPSSFAELEQVCAQSGGRMHAYNFAVGRTQGKVNFRLHPQHNTSSSMLPRTELLGSLVPETVEETVIEVDLTTLDTLFAEQMASATGRILLKLDVQGFELDVLAGANRLLKRVDYLLTEISLAPIYIGQSGFDDVHGVLAAAGFRLKGFIEQSHAADLTPIYADALYVNGNS